MLPPPCGIKLMRVGVVQWASDGGFSAEAGSNRFNPEQHPTRVDSRPCVRYCGPHPLIRLLWIFGHQQGVREMGSDPGDESLRDRNPLGPT